MSVGVEMGWMSILMMSSQVQSMSSIGFDSSEGWV